MKICQNIDDCESILIFVTSKFMGKVNGMDGNNDICKVEYDYALRTASSKLVIVILEERMKVLSQWKGALRYTCHAVHIMLRVDTSLLHKNIFDLTVSLHPHKPLLTLLPFLFPRPENASETKRN